MKEELKKRIIDALEYSAETLRQSADIIEDNCGDPDEECADVRIKADEIDALARELTVSSGGAS